MVDIGSKLVGAGGLGTGTKEWSFGLEVVETMLKFSNGFGKGRVNFSEVCHLGSHFVYPDQAC
jgi:hypothetical protein